MKSHSSRRRAFSRTEAFAIVGVTLLSGAALWPAVAQGSLFDVFGRARENARRSACQSNLKQISLGLLQYQQDYDEKSPPVSTPNTPGPYGNFGWANVLQPYIRSTQLFQCPSERHQDETSPDATKPGYTDYWMNSRVSGLEMVKMESPAQSVVFGDGDGGSPNSTARYNIPSIPYSWRVTPNSPARRHIEMANYAFLDGHVKSLRPSSVTMAPLSQMSKYNASATFSPR